LKKSIEYLAEHVDQSVLEDALADQLSQPGQAETKEISQFQTKTATDEYIINYLIENHVETGILIKALKESEEQNKEQKTAR